MKNFLNKIILIFLILIFFSCGNKENDSEIIEKYDFDNFLFFKKNMTIRDVEKILNEKKINFYETKKNASKFINKVDKIAKRKELIVKSLKIINQEFPEVTLTFINDTLAQLQYYIHLREYEPNLGFPGSKNNIHQYDNIISQIKKDDILFKEIFDALFEKYGLPDGLNSNDTLIPNINLYCDDSYSYDFESLSKYNGLSENVKWLSKKKVEIKINKHLSCAITGNSANRSASTYYFSSFDVYFDKSSLLKWEKTRNKFLSKHYDSIRKYNDSIKEIKKQKRREILKRI